MRGLSYNTNGDWDNFLASANDDTATKYHESVEEYSKFCMQKNIVMLIASSVKFYSQHRHDTPRLCKRINHAALYCRTATERGTMEKAPATVTDCIFRRSLLVNNSGAD